MNVKDLRDFLLTLPPELPVLIEWIDYDTMEAPVQRRWVSRAAVRDSNATLNPSYKYVGLR